VHNFSHYVSCVVATQPTLPTENTLATE